ncbi:MAG: PaaI family thioesterase [Halieaceae bacterium]|jgi:acyl-CoA thioesterase|nr:PaaI family thioesterase [Halieaceae bacterium]
MVANQTIDRLNEHRPACVNSLGGSVVGVDPDNNSASMAFTIGPEFCHSGNIVQGGFVAAMLDAAMSHTVFGCIDNVGSLASLELKISYLAPSLTGTYTATGQIVKAGKSIAFLQGKLFASDGTLTATASSTAKISLLAQD